MTPHLPGLRARVRRAIRGRPEFDPEDIVQECLIRGYQALSLFDERYSFAQYLFGIARYAILRRVGSRQREIAVAWQDSGGASAPGSTPLPRDSEIPEAFAAVAGAARFPPPDARVTARNRFRVLLGAFLTHGGYPHQQIAFGFSVVVFGKAKERRATGRGSNEKPRFRPDKVEVTGDPDRVVRELTDVPLDRSGKDLKAEIEGMDAFLPRDLDDQFRPLFHRLGLPGRSLFAKDPVSRARFRRLDDTRIGETRLADYYGSDPRRSVADWSKAVKSRVRRFLQGESDVAGSSLPTPVRRCTPSTTHPPEA